MKLVSSSTRPYGEIWMELRDRKKLQRLMIVQEVSQRELAAAAGWKSHTYLGKLLRGDKRTLETEPALRIAYALHVGVEDLFLTKMDTSAYVSGQEPVPARTRKKAAA